MNDKDFFKVQVDFRRESGAELSDDCLRSNILLVVVDFAKDAANSIGAGLVALAILTSPLQTWQRIVPSVIKGDEDASEMTNIEAAPGMPRAIDDAWYSQPQDEEGLAKVLQLGHRTPGLDHLI